MNSSIAAATTLPGINAHGDLAIRTLRGREGFRQLAGEWTSVLGRIEHPEFFHRYEWYDALLDAWPEIAADTFFLIAYRGDVPIGICPLHLGSTRVHGLPVRTLSPPDPNDVAYPDFICSRADSTELFAALLRELRASRDIKWDLLTLPRIFSTAENTAALLANGGVFTHQRGVCYYFHADQGKAAIADRVSSGLRKHLRWCRRQLNALGTVEFISSSDPRVLPGLLEEFLALEASGWKGAAGEATAIKLDPALVQFYAGLLARFGESGDCEINLLRLNGRNIAGQFCLISGGTWYHLKIAYDEEVDKYSPGSVLLEEVFDRLCAADRVQIASFLTGAAWAERWHALELGVYRVVARNRTMAGRIALQQIKLRRAARERLIPLLARLRKK